MEKNEHVNQKNDTKNEDQAKNATFIKWHSYMLVESKGFSAGSTFADGLFH